MTKRAFDVVVALVGMALLAPLFLLLWLLVRWQLGVPALYVQERPGLRGQPFRMFKFRTMTDERNADDRLKPDAERLNRFGRFLRSTSLDELPELYNVLKGDMSLVGPRPLLMEYLPLYTTRQLRRHEVRPGITGWAQVNGRNAISWERKFELDVWYVDHASFWLDMRILWLTLWRVITREGISSAESATAERFTGSQGESSGNAQGQIE